MAETSGQGEATLVGNQCTRCGTTFFPAHALCTSCLTDRFLEPARLSRQGTVYAWTVVYQSLPEFQVPYVLAYVDFPENVRVLAQVRDVTPEQMRTGLAVEVLRVPTSPRDGAAYWNVQGFAFRPVEDEQEVAHG